MICGSEGGTYTECETVFWDVMTCSLVGIYLRSTEMWGNFY
jgi:hypothetical protein